MEYVLTFLEGFASFISPCVLPLVPIYISYLMGKKQTKSNAFLNSIAFVLGFTIVFTLLAILSNIIGRYVSQFISVFKTIFGCLIILLGLSYVGLFELNIFNKLKKYNANVEKLNFIKSISFGMMFAISMTPCVGTFLASALLFIATTEKLIKGIILIIIYCLGLGIPFIISSILIDKLKNVFNFIKKNYKVIKILSGIILIVMGIYMIW